MSNPPIIRPSRFNPDFPNEALNSQPQTSQSDPPNIPTLVENPTENTNPPPVTRAMSHADYTLVRMYIENIPKFNGDNPQLLPKFIRASDELLQAFPSENVAFNLFLFSSIKGRLIGQADLAISCRLELDNWEALKKVLIELFGDGHTISSLQTKLIHVQPDPKQSTKQLGQTIMSILSNLVAKINEQVRPFEEKQAQVNIYSEMALETYTRCLPYQYKQLIRTRAIKNITEAIQVIAIEEQFNESAQTLRNIPQKTKTSITKPNYSQNQQYSNRVSLPVSNFQNFQKPQAYSQNFNKPMQQPLRQPSYNNNTNTTTPKPTAPTPMSGISTIQTNQNKPYQQPFKPKPSEWYNKNVQKTGQTFQNLSLNNIENSEISADNETYQPDYSWNTPEYNTQYMTPQYNELPDASYETNDFNEYDYSLNSYLEPNNDENFPKRASDNSQM